MKEEIFGEQDIYAIGKSLKKQYGNSLPFPHIVIDGLIDDDFLKQIIQEFPDKKDNLAWNHHFHENSKKFSSRDWNVFGLKTKEMLNYFNSTEFLLFLEELTNIEGLIPDPYLFGGGIHMLEREGFLNVHADFNYHPKWKLDRRLNLLLYLNENWLDEYNGHLELWDASLSNCAKKIAPIANRIVVFSTNDVSFHGHPLPLNCPKDKPRKSIALYYYTNGRPDFEKSKEHSTIYKSVSS